MLTFFPIQTFAINLEGTIALNDEPNEIAINSDTNMIYVTTTYTVSVIDGHTNNITKVIPLAKIPVEIFADEATNKIYVNTHALGFPTVIDSTTGEVTDIPFMSLVKAVNPYTNKIYMTNRTNIVYALDSLSHEIIDSITLSESSGYVAVNSNTNTIYAMQNNTVVVINGSSKRIVDAGIVVGALDSRWGAIGSTPTGIAVNPTTNKIYVASLGVFPPPGPNEGLRLPVGSVSVIDGFTNKIVANIEVTLPNGIAVNPNTNRIFVTNSFDDQVNVIDGLGNSIEHTINVGNYPLGIAVNTKTNKVYVANHLSNSISVISDQKYDKVDNHQDVILPPLKQLKLGVLPDDVVCRENLVLIKRIMSDTPACVKIDTAQKLVERGWGTMEILRKTSIGESFSTTFGLKICGEDKDPVGTPGNLKPLELKRGGGQKVILLCVQAPDEVARSWDLKVVETFNPLLPPQHGINVELDKIRLDLPARTIGLDEYLASKSNAPDLIVKVSADDDAELGTHSFSIQATTPSSIAYNTVTRAIYVNITE